MNTMKMRRRLIIIFVVFVGCEFDLSSPSYTCTSSGCKFFIHQPCALKIPPKLIHPSHPRTSNKTHKLFIKKSSPNFTYNCEDCELEIHPLVAVVPQVEIKIKHKSHPPHPLVAICRLTSTMCDVCGKKHEQEGFFFSCQECNFWVHQDCTVLPNSIMIADFPKPFILSYSLPTYQAHDSCIICHQPLLLRHNGVYFCPQFKIFAHIRCGKDKFASKTRRLELMKVPDDEWDVFPSLVVRRYAERKPLDLDDDDKNNKLTIEKYHKHPLNILNIDGDRRKAACDLCTRPINKNKISSSFYRCSDIDCHFAAHNICADILPILNFFLPSGVEVSDDNRAKVCRDPSEIFFNSVFYCIFCHRPCNGICYYFPSFTHGDGIPFIFIDLECMAAPSFINHASHPQHLLFRTSRIPALSTPLTCCPDDSFLYDVYRCIFCEYNIHIRCATLPKRIIRHEYDDHPLHLVFPNQEMMMINNCFCEVCEEVMDIKYWLYRCGECDKWFHVNCIPDVGYLSKVKFGGTMLISVPHLDHHPQECDHVMALTRMLTVATQRCAYCKKLIQGYVDEMAFSCSLCPFWIHFSCARPPTHHSSTSKPLLYSEFDDKRLSAMVSKAITPS